MQKALYQLSAESFQTALTIFPEQLKIDFATSFGINTFRSLLKIVLSPFQIPYALRLLVAASSRALCDLRISLRVRVLRLIGGHI